MFAKLYAVQMGECYGTNNEIFILKYLLYYLYGDVEKSLFNSKTFHKENHNGNYKKTQK